MTLLCRGVLFIRPGLAVSPPPGRWRAAQPAGVSVATGSALGAAVGSGVGVGTSVGTAVGSGVGDESS